ncbi:MAG: hypothetical protein ACRDRS_26995, partial [Pseudonocardiaceae bacterium]
RTPSRTALCHPNSTAELSGANTTALLLSSGDTEFGGLRWAGLWMAGLVWITEGLRGRVGGLVAATWAQCTVWGI